MPRIQFHRGICGEEKVKRLENDDLFLLITSSNIQQVSHSHKCGKCHVSDNERNAPHNTTLRIERYADVAQCADADVRLGESASFVGEHVSFW